MSRFVFAVIALSVAACSTAEAKEPSEPPAGAPPGITVTGTGLASVEAPRRLTEASIDRAVALARRPAVSRALNGARRRATALAAATGLTLGPARSVSEDLGVPFARPAEQDHCRRSRRRRRVICRVPDTVTVRLVVNYATTGGAEGADSLVSASASARSAVRPNSRRSNRAIRDAVAAAYGRATPLAFAAARDRADQLAAASHATLGPLVGVSEETGGPFLSPDVGPFGPGLYCGTIRRPVFERVPGSRRRRVVRRVRERICEVPRFAEAALIVTYAASPQAAAAAADPVGVAD